MVEADQAGVPTDWKEPDSLRATVERRAIGMLMSDSLTMGGMIGDVPPGGMPPPPPSLAYLSIRKDGRRFDGYGRHAPIPRPSCGRRS